MITRRKFFSGSALAAGSVAGFPHLAQPAGVLPSAPGQKPGRIIHLVADGMSLGTLTCADYLSHHLRRRGLAWMELFRKPQARCGLMNMRSLNSMVTDSSAASSSWGSGSRIVNGVLNQLPSGKNLVTLYELFAGLGWKRGLVTTTEITHATPAGFAASVDSRDNGAGIAAQYLQRKVDVLLGGGQKFFDPKRRKDKRDLQSEFAAAGYQVMVSAPELAGAPVDKRWLGLFSDSHLPFTIDQQADGKLQASVPALAVMTRRALEWLGRQDHFILQVEGGRVDHAAHNCDAPAALFDLIAFDEALDAVLEFQQRQPDTLIVVTTDHGNGNLGVNGSGKAYGQSSQMFEKVAGVKASFAEILRQLRQQPPEDAVVEEDQKEDAAPPSNGDAKAAAKAATKEQTEAAEETPAAAAKAKPKDYLPTVKEIQEIVGGATGYKVSERRAEGFQAYLAKKGSCLYELMNSDVAQLGQLLANHIAVGWAGNVHTADYVPVTALGPGAERFEGFIQNVDVFRHYTQLAGIDFKNPEEPMIAAARNPEAADVENLAEYACV
ncbi:MAG: alkaline phosphatase [Chloroflexi bacterium]|nr:alkaline phosphatase [Chloroflexota bacterium]